MCSFKCCIILTFNRLYHETARAYADDAVLKLTNNECLAVKHLFETVTKKLICLH